MMTLLPSLLKFWIVTVRLRQHLIPFAGGNFLSDTGPIVTMMRMMVFSAASVSSMSHKECHLTSYFGLTVMYVGYRCKVCAFDSNAASRRYKCESC